MTQQSDIIIIEELKIWAVGHLKPSSKAAGHAKLIDYVLMVIFQLNLG